MWTMHSLSEHRYIDRFVSFRPTLEESGMVELNKKPLFVYTGSDVDRKEQAALFEALNPNIQEMNVPKSPKSPTVPKDDVELMRERRNSGSAASSPRHPSSPRRSVHAQCRIEICS